MMRIIIPISGELVVAAFFLAFSLPALAGTWMHLQNEGDSCAARRAGTKVDTLMMLNRDGQLILIAGHPNWNLKYSGPREVSLLIGNQKVKHLKGYPFRSLFMVLIKNNATVTRLEHAKRLTWNLPFGTYHANIAGLGKALSWIRECEKGKLSEQR